MGLEYLPTFTDDFIPYTEHLGMVSSWRETRSWRIFRIFRFQLQSSCCFWGIFRSLISTCPQAATTSKDKPRIYMVFVNCVGGSPMSIKTTTWIPAIAMKQNICVVCVMWGKFTTMTISIHDSIKGLLIITCIFSSSLMQPTYEWILLGLLWPKTTSSSHLENLLQAWKPAAVGFGKHRIQWTTSSRDEKGGSMKKRLFLKRSRESIWKVFVFV